MSHTKKNFIVQLTKDLENLGIEKDKEEFIKNYANLKEQIEQTDKILEDDLSNQDNQINYGEMNLNELFQILEDNSDLINNIEILETSKLKILSTVSKIIEEKIHNETINIINIK